MDKATYEVLTPIEHDGERYEIKAPIDLDEKTAKPLIAVKAIKAEPISPAQPVTPTDPAERAALIAEAIGKLDPENADHWLKNGQPDLAAISQILGWQPSAGERNSVWAELQKPKDE